MGRGGGPAAGHGPPGRQDHAAQPGADSPPPRGQDLQDPAALRQVATFLLFYLHIPTPVP